MIKISKEEAFYLRDHGRWYDIHMSSSTHKAKRKRYWMTASPKSVKLLNLYRENEKCSMGGE